MTKLPFALAAAALFLSSAHASEALRFEGVRFKGCYDGDTCYFDFTTVEPALFGQGRAVRFLGIDTPEIKGSCKREVRAAERARDALIKRLERAGEIVIESPGLDKYGRILGRVIADGQDLSELLIAKGLARKYQGGHRKGWC